MSNELKGRTIAFLAADGVEKVELEQPRSAVEDAGGRVVLLSVKSGEIEARNHDLEPAGTFAVDRVVADAVRRRVRRLVLPGGTVNPDKLRIDESAVAFVRDFVNLGQAGGGDLPRALDAGGGRRRAGSDADVLPQHPNRSPQRRRHRRRPGGVHRRQPRHQPLAGRSARLLPGDHRPGGCHAGPHLRSGATTTPCRRCPGRGRAPGNWSSPSPASG